VTITKQTKSGLTVRANYTLSNALDDYLSNQNNAGFYSNSFHPGVEYGPSSYDRKHVFNAYYTYELPLGPGHAIHTGNSSTGSWVAGTPPAS